MAQRISPLLPASELLLEHLGERLRLARLRRRLTAKQMTERAGMAPMTLRSLERGGSGVTIGAYVAVMQVLGLERDLDFLAQADTVGRELQDAQLRMRVRRETPRNAPSDPNVAPLSKERPASPRSAVVKQREQHHAPRARPKTPSKPGKRWDDAFESSEAMAELLDAQPATRKPKKRR